MIPAQSTLMRMHPRGFLGGFPPPQIERESVIDRPVFDHQYRLNIVKPSDPSTYPNKNITALYTQQIGGGLAPTLLAFREQVLKEALAAFGISRFDRWYLQQLQSPAYGDNHARFLDDTFNFIRGKRREMHPMTWASLIDMEKNPGNLKPSAIAVEFFDLRNVNADVRFTANDELVNVIQTWCSRPGGFEDMLCTLNILFGSY